MAGMAERLAWRKRVAPRSAFKTLGDSIIDAELLISPPERTQTGMAGHEFLSPIFGVGYPHRNKIRVL
jgi:hypothetical protein